MNVYTGAFISVSVGIQGRRASFEQPQRWVAFSSTAVNKKMRFLAISHSVLIAICFGISGGKGHVINTLLTKLAAAHLEMQNAGCEKGWKT